MSRSKGSTPWNKGISGYKFRSDIRLHNLTLDSLKQDILAGFSLSDTKKKYQISEPTVYKYVYRLSNEIKQRFHLNGMRKSVEGHRTPQYRQKMSELFKGRFSPLKGKTYFEILGSKERAFARVDKTREFMLTDRNVRKYMKRTSKGQLALFEIVKKKYPDAVLEYPIQVSVKKTIWLDIAIPSRKLNFEYDGTFWHQLDEQKARDRNRDSFLLSQGWKVIRIQEGQDLSCATL